MPQIIPIRDLKNTSAISERCKKVDEPIFVTKNGYGDMVVMSINHYSKTMAQLDLYKSLKKAEDEMENGAVAVDSFELLAELKKKNEK